MDNRNPEIIHFMFVAIDIKWLKQVIEKEGNQKDDAYNPDQFFAFIIKRIRLFQEKRKSAFRIHFFYALTVLPFQRKDNCTRYNDEHKNIQNFSGKQQMKIKSRNFATIVNNDPASV
ncbi:MAG TPA: hypothetical protein VJL37_11855 [Flavobacterium sp.]|nr:hypothetical protein [Flavobacterium sp.]